MALVTPEFLQTKTYSALRDRLAMQHGGPVQAGVWDAGDFKVTQRAAGANMTIDAAAGFALVSANDPGNAGLYHLQNDASVNVTGFVGSNGTLPRVDSVYVQVNDTTHGGDGTDIPTFGVATGTATAGVTLDNRTGAAAIPTGALLLADVLIPAASSSIVTANIRDRRPWARGVYWSQRLQLGSDITVNGAGFADLDATNLKPRIEFSGVPVRIGVQGTFNHSITGGVFATSILLTSGQLGQFQQTRNSGAATADTTFNDHRLLMPTPGSQLVSFQAWNPSGGTALARAASPHILNMYIIEDIRQNSSN